MCSASTATRAWHGVVLRVDPVIPYEKGVLVAKGVIGERDAAGRARISFLDLYPHVKKNFLDEGFTLPWDTFHAPLELRQKAWEELGRPEICGEPGFLCTGCVSAQDCKVFNVKPSDGSGGQRKFCACLANKKELLTSRSPCPHNCIYCYWGSSSARKGVDGVD